MSIFQPLTGVSITVRPEGTQTVTDESGNFQLAASIGDTLEFAFLGYETATHVVENNDPIVETLVLAGATDLEEAHLILPLNRKAEKAKGPAFWVAEPFLST